MTPPRVAIAPFASPAAEQAVRDGGGQVAADPEHADALVWLAFWDAEGLARALQGSPARWVQLASAGIEQMAGSGVLDPARTWTCAKGAYAEPVAEHALALALAGLRCLPERVTATSWGRPAGVTLFDQPVTILGAGGIAASLLRLLVPFRVRATVVRRGGVPLPGAARTVPAAMLTEALADALVVFVVLALTPATERIIGAEQLSAMRPDAWLVNVARGRHVDTDALVSALDRGAIGGAALDVTDPEPLPDGHPLWGHPRCIITPHTADTLEMVEPLLAERIRLNVARFAAGEQLAGLVDPNAGY
jgi:phosphoglycerate dehydrogenase-like enzyme